MKKKIGSFLTLISLVCWLVPSPAKADTVTLFSNLTTSGTFACGVGGASDVPCDLNGFYKVSVQVTCTSAPCTGEWKLQQRNTSSDAWATVLDLFNPGLNDQGYSNTGFGQIQVVVIWTAGTWQGTLQRIK